MNISNMNLHNGFIYIRQHISYKNDKICKLGKTKNIFDRDNCYATSEYERGYFSLVIKILNNQIFDDTYVEKLLEKYFKNYHSKKNGGNEFYKIEIIDEIIPFLYKTQIKFKVLTIEEINLLMKQERISELKKLIKKIYNNKKTKENIIRDKLQKDYTNEIIDNLIKYNKVFLKAPTGFGKTQTEKLYQTISI